MFTAFIGTISFVAGGVVMFFVAKNNKEKFFGSLDMKFRSIATLLKTEALEGVDLNNLRRKINELKEKIENQ